MAETQENKQEPLPFDETINLIDHRTIYKTEKWWCEVVLGNMFGHDKIMVYLWQRKDNGQWKRKQKMGINFSKDWENIKKAVDEFMPRIRTVTG